MTSKAERRRNKRVVLMAGRPRLEGPREPNGRVNRTWQANESERAATQSAREARQRLFGVREEYAHLPEAMTVLGRLKLVEVISPEQYDAARRYQETRVRYQRAIGATPDYDEPAPDVWDRTGADPVEWAANARERHAEMMAVLADLCQEIRSPAPKAALDVIVHRDIEMPELNGALRLALNALDRHFTQSKQVSTIRAA